MHARNRALFTCKYLNFLVSICFSLSQLFILMKSKMSFFAIKVAVSPSQPSFAPYNASFSRKHVSAPALEQNETWRAIFTMNRVAEMAPDPNMLMFGDEAVRDICTLFRKDGRSLKGCKRNISYVVPTTRLSHSSHLMA